MEPMKRDDFRFFHRMRVRWAEVDMQKIVFNAHYLMYIDTAVAGDAILEVMSEQHALLPRHRFRAFGNGFPGRSLPVALENPGRGR